MGLLEGDSYYVVICQYGNTAKWVKEKASAYLGVNPDYIYASNADAILSSDEEKDKVILHSIGATVGVFNRAEEKITKVMDEIRKNAKVVHLGTSFFDHFG